MRKTVLPILGSSILAVAATAALAADLPSRVAPPVFVPPPIPAFTWTGFYIGANAGAAFDERRQNSYVFSNNGGANTIVGSGGTNGVLTLGGSNRTAFTGGGQIGYNYQFNPGSSAVIGIEADAQYLGFRGDNGGTTNYGFTPVSNVGNADYGLAFVPLQIPGAAATTVIRTQQRSDFFGTVRGRLGYAFDRVLVYGTGGFAYNGNAIGYAAGGGLEYAITNNITIRGEYLYVNLDRSSSFNAVFTNGVGFAPGTLVLNGRGGRDSFSVARAALNYKLDFWAPAPVVARY